MTPTQESRLWMIIKRQEDALSDLQKAIVTIPAVRLHNDMKRLRQNNIKLRSENATLRKQNKELTNALEVAP